MYRDTGGRGDGGSQGGEGTAGSLARMHTQLRKITQDAAIGFTLAAPIVMKMVAQWDELYRAEAGDKDAATWVKASLHPSEGMPYFQRLNESIEAVGKSMARRFRSDALHIAAHVAEPHREEFMDKASKLFKRCHSTPLTSAQTVRLRNAVEKRVPKAKVCHRCERLEAQLIAMGVTPDE